MIYKWIGAALIIVGCGAFGFGVLILNYDDDGNRVNAGEGSELCARCASSKGYIR